MKLSLVPLALACALPAFAQNAERNWYVDVHRFTPSLDGHIQGLSGDNAFDVNFQDDLGLGRSTTQIGYGLEYQGTRFGLEFSSDAQDYTGQKLVQRPIEVDGETFNPNTLVSSRIKATNSTLNWTIRVFRWPSFWAGVDLGVRATQLQVDANGSNALLGIQTAVDYKTTLPVPQLGPSLGFSALHDQLVGRGMFHALTYKGCTYTHLGIDLRYFPISWLGAMVYLDKEHFRIPEGSIKSNLDITLDRDGVGFGVVARF